MCLFGVLCCPYILRCQNENWTEVFALQDRFISHLEYHGMPSCCQRSFWSCIPRIGTNNADSSHLTPTRKEQNKHVIEHVRCWKHVLYTVLETSEERANSDTVAVECPQKTFCHPMPKAFRESNQGKNWDISNGYPMEVQDLVFSSP